MTKEFTVQDMSCQHCVNAITKEVSAVDGVQNVTIDLATKRVRIQTNEQVPTDKLVEAINEAGYVNVATLN